MKNLLLRARDFDRTSKIKISRRRLTEYVLKYSPESVPHVQHDYFPRSTTESIDLWRCCHFLNSLMNIQSRRQPQSEKSSFPGKQISVSGVSLVWKIMELSDVEIDGTPTPQKQTSKHTK